MTGHTIARYRVAPGQAERNEELVRAVYAQLDDRLPAGLRYATYVLEDGVSFVHVASHEDTGALTELPAFRAFGRELADRCEEAPAVRTARLIGRFG